MPTRSQILFIDDDPDDYEFLLDCLHELNLPNELIWMQDADRVIEYLLTTTDNLLFILCDINMPKINGVDLKRQIDGNATLKKMSIPFLFYSTHASKQIVTAAYETLNVQGFFKKQVDPAENLKTIQSIVDYWSWCVHPNSM